MRRRGAAGAIHDAIRRKRKITEKNVKNSDRVNNENEESAGGSAVEIVAQPLIRAAMAGPRTRLAPS